MDNFRNVPTMLSLPPASWHDLTDWSNHITDEHIPPIKVLGYHKHFNLSVRAGRDFYFFSDFESFPNQIC